jgi:hypothetical protein
MQVMQGLKLSGERDGGLGLARFSAVCPLGGHMHHVRKWPLLIAVAWLVRRYGRWQVLHVYGPNLAADGGWRPGPDGRWQCQWQMADVGACAMCDWQ